jgi:hypothetical protein
MKTKTSLWLFLVTLSALMLLHVAACSSSSDPTPTVPTNQTQDSGQQQMVQGEDSSPGPAYDSSGGMTVNCGGEVCVKGDICVEDNVDGGASYHCKGLPAACDGTPSCACAGFQCAPSTTCKSASGLTLTCSS